MPDLINVHDFKTHYSNYLDKVASGQEILLGKHGKVVAKIVPLNQDHQPRTPGSLKGKVWVSDDFDIPMNTLWDVLKAK
jgi:prevent-host-death family protein